MQRTGPSVTGEPFNTSQADGGGSIAPVAVAAGVLDHRQVGGVLEGVVGALHGRRVATGDGVADGRRAAPPLAGQTLELIGDLWQEALPTAGGGETHTPTCTHTQHTHTHAHATHTCTYTHTHNTHIEPHA